MNIFEFAMKMEEDGREYYLAQAQKTDNHGIKSILTELAEDELKHYNIFKALRDKGIAEYRDEEKTTILSTTKNVFEALKSEDKEFNFSGEMQDIWRRALEVEIESEKLYREKADEADDANFKDIFNKIADEERRHQMVIENVIDFLNRPKQWLENAEWHHLEDY
jgi:rubrerythrin